jgi:hypothetical protein
MDPVAKSLQRFFIANPQRNALQLLNSIEERHGLLAQATEARIRRQTWLRRIAECAEGGKVALCRWYRDCDYSEGTDRTLVAANVAALDARVEQDWEHAEGPMRHWIQRPSDAFEIYSRDRALEAFENGHPHCIHI